MSNQTQRYRILGWIACNDSGYVTKGKTIRQCDSFDEALEHLKNIHANNIECTYFTIERGEWM